jgi:hypothetical protein
VNTFSHIGDNYVYDRYPGDSTELNGPSDTLFCVNGGLTGGSTFGTITTYLIDGGNAGSGYVTYTQSGAKSVTIDLTCQASASGGYSGDQQTAMTSVGWVILVIKNRGSSVAYLKYQKNITHNVAGFANAWTRTTIDYNTVQTCSAVGLTLTMGTTRLLSSQRSGPGAITDEGGGVGIAIPPGIHYVQLYHATACVAVSLPGGGSSATMGGTITLSVEP